MCRTQETTPPWTCTASRKPAALTAASASAERTPDLQYSTIWRSWGRLARALPETISPLGSSREPGILTISYSAGSRTSTSSIDLPASIQSFSSLVVIVGPSPHNAQFGSLRTLIVRYDISSASYTMSRPTSGSPVPVSSLIASVTWIEPMLAQSTPSTPPSAQDGTMPGGGGSG